MLDFILDVAFRLAPRKLFECSRSPSEAVKYIVTNVKEAVDAFFPKEKTNRLKQDLPWITKKI